MKKILIYGATGYTGRMVSERAKAAGVPLILAGRDKDRLSSLATELDVPYRVFQVDDQAAGKAALAEASVVLNCAGPYRRTAEPMMRAALSTGTHYLDIAAELDSYRLSEKLDLKAKNAGVMLLPGSGGSVAMLGCLCGYATSRVTEPRKLSVALYLSGSLSRGTAISAAGSRIEGYLKRVNNSIVTRSSDEVRAFDFGAGPVTCFPATLPDLITIWKSTHVPNIETFIHLPENAFPEGDLTTLPEGPSEEERAAHPLSAAVEVNGADGETVHGILRTMNGYTFTAMAAAEAARRVWAGEARPGFQTPAGLFGNGFAESVPNTHIQIA